MEPSGSLLVLIKLQENPLQLDVNAATGGWFADVIVTGCEIALVAPWLSVTVMVTEYEPAAA